LGSEHLAVYLHQHLIQTPLPMCSRPHSINPSAADLSGKHRAKSVPPRPNRLMANVNAAFMQKIFNIPQRKRKPHIHHNGRADDLRARLEVTKGGTFCHPERLCGRPVRIKKISSDSAASRDAGIEVGKGLAEGRQYYDCLREPSSSTALWWREGSDHGDRF
jgi:hypothetical protein